MASTSITSTKFPEFFYKRCEEGDLVCAICHDIYKDPYFINLQPCLHTFCRDCVNRTMQNKDGANCPQCRRPYTKENLTYDYRRYSNIINLWNIYAPNYGIKGKNPYENTHQERAPWQEAQSSFAAITHANQTLPSAFFSEKISLLNCITKEDITSTDTITARGCTLSGKAFAIENVTLVDTNFKQIVSASEGISCKASPPMFLECKGQSIDANKDVLVENTHVTSFVESRSGGIIARHCRLNALIAELNIEVSASSFTSLLSRSGSVLCQDIGEHTPAHFIEAHGNITLKNARLSEFVTSNNGRVLTTRASVNRVQAKQSVELKETTVFSTVYSEQIATLENSKVWGDVFCRSQLTLNNSRIGSAEISFCSERGVQPTIFVILTGDSVINGDLFIKPAEGNQPQQPCIVEIHGKELFSGQVKFLGCTGQVL